MAAADLRFAVEDGSKQYSQHSCTLQSANEAQTLFSRGILLIYLETPHIRWCARWILRAAVCPLAPCRARLPRGLHLALAEALTVRGGGCMRNCSCRKLAVDCARRVRDGDEHQNASSKVPTAPARLGVHGPVYT